VDSLPVASQFQIKYRRKTITHILFHVYVIYIGVITYLKVNKLNCEKWQMSSRIVLRSEAIVAYYCCNENQQ